MRIWRQALTVDDLNQYQQQTLVTHLGIHYTEVGDDYLKAAMPVDARTKQPAGILHGGASAALAETLGSTGANLVVDRATTLCVGLELNCNHIRAMRDGQVTGTARPLHVGRTTQVWEIKITDDQDRLVCVSRITMAVLQRSKISARP
ncbi:MAG: hotdog fold thioesterase [Gammaproteobacteria bacterium]|nr:hotdog fold thioesterase [Gammaproteobacteria bacterium]MBU6509653.1 hotdog fold thioesterase [Gammaproteobacteria bacterium]MDE1983983.1 hotdog fold thioesterase [Gammaproteobacteria bacterium]MDE2461143.1 hotdog fold thioesterase [Gammaproteobacteria bacterium]